MSEPRFRLAVQGLFDQSVFTALLANLLTHQKRSESLSQELSPVLKIFKVSVLLDFVS
jgi:hypothetical protein